MSQPFAHEPVMVDEVVEILGAVPAGVIVDATVGGGGHAAAILAARPDTTLVALDRDADAVNAATERLARFGDRVDVRHARFDVIAGDDFRTEEPVVGFLFDLGVSSPQIDLAERGFSYRSDAPLDMRMDRSQTKTAARVVNEYDEEELAALFAAHGERRFARRIARALVGRRPVHTTSEVADTVAAAVPAAARRRGHPAKRVFQALRVEVNEELTVLPTALDAAVAALVPGGRCVVLSYHSGEDTIVKDMFRLAATGGCECPPRLPCGCGARPVVRDLGRRLPSAAEVARNPRAESARLRAVEKLAGENGPDRR